jgi:hypothetical protein
MPVRPANVGRSRADGHTAQIHPIYSTSVSPRRSGCMLSMWYAPRENWHVWTGATRPGIASDAYVRPPEPLLRATFSTRSVSFIFLALSKVFVGYNSEVDCTSHGSYQLASYGVLHHACRVSSALFNLYFSFTYGTLRLVSFCKHKDKGGLYMQHRPQQIC